MKKEEKKKDKVYRETLGVPEANKDELKKENEIFLNDDTKAADQRKILYNKISRIEQMLYFVTGVVTAIFIYEMISFVTSIFE